MTRILLQRLVALLPILFGIAVLTFFAVRLVPGDVVDVMLGQHHNPETAAELRRFMGVDRPLSIQFLDWFGGLVQGDLGNSFRTGKPVLSELLQRFPATLELTLAALLISLTLSIPMGILSALRRNSPTDLAARLFALLGISMPQFWLGILLILLFSVAWRLLPAGGYVRPQESVPQNLKLLLMPALTLGLGMAAVTMRMTRAAVLEVMAQDYVRTARAKGLRELIVTSRHILKNALLPVITVVGVQTGRLLGGTVVVEEIFSWPGIGSMVVRAILQRDYPLVQGAVMMLAFTFLLMNLIVDLLYLVIDPRLRSTG